jgi:invasion protein IalB
MRQQTAIIILIVAIVAVAIVGGVIFFWPQQQQAGGVPPLPPGTRSFGNWALVCGQQNVESGARCNLLMRVIDQESQRLVTSVNLTRGPQGNAIFVINTPPGIVIPAGVSITPAEGTVATGAVQTCRANGCTGIVVASDTLVTELSSAPTMGIGYTAPNGRPVNFNLPATGFQQGYNAWLAEFPAPPPVEGEAADADADAAPEGAAATPAP